jgi:hypothetical protein
VIKKYFFFFLSSIGLLSARETRSNHSYQALGFTRLPTVEITAEVDGMVSHITQSELYGKRKMSVYYNNNANAEEIKNKLSEEKQIQMAIDSSLFVNINAVNDFGLKYGAFLELNANTTKNSFNENLNVNQSFLYGEFIYGKIEFGATEGASQKMKVGAETLVRGRKNGINGAYLNFVNLPSLSKNSSAGAVPPPLYILVPQHPTAHGGFGLGFNNLLYKCDFDGNGKLELLDPLDPAAPSGPEIDCFKKYATGADSDNYYLNLDEMSNAVKISYYTPELYGLQLGVSYTPDTGDRGVGSRNSSSNDINDISNIIEYGAIYADTFYGIGVSLGYTAQSGKTEALQLADGSTDEYEPFRNDLESTQFGGILSFYGLSIGASVGNWGESLQYKTLIEKNKGKYETFGMSYEFGPLILSGTHFSSIFQENKYTANSFNLDYKMSRNFLPYIEITKFKFNTTETEIEENKGTIIRTGFNLTF